MREIPWIAGRQCGVFSHKQALSGGWTRAALAHAIATGRLTRLRVGVYQTTDTGHLDRFEQARWQHAAPAIAAVLTIPGALASHSTGAVLHGMPLLFIPEQACVSVVPWHTGEIPRVHVHRCTSAPMSLPVGEVGCTGIERIGIDLAREHGVAAGVVALDYILRRELSDRIRLDAELRRCYRWPGVRAAREAVRRADPLSESPLESQSRLKFSSFGIPEPTLQVRIGDGLRRFLARVDFYWDEFGVVGEADGALKYGDDAPAGTLHEEKLRQEGLERTGLGVVRWGSADLFQFQSVADRLLRAFDRGRRRPADERRWTILPVVPL